MSDIILAHGNYQELESYKNSIVIYNATKDFCKRFLARGDRTNDQMVQAARSGKQNIVEGSMASGISAETEIKLIGVARASLEELLEDYRDFLRVRNLAIWQKDEPQTLKLRQLAKQKNKSYETYKTYLLSNDIELICNLLISLIHQTNYLLDRQLKSLQETFVKKGGLRERMFNARKQYRQNAGRFDEELACLREIYREIAACDLPAGTQKTLLQKIKSVADAFKQK